MRLFSNSKSERGCFVKYFSALGEQQLGEQKRLKWHLYWATYKYALNDYEGNIRIHFIFLILIIEVFIENVLHLMEIFEDPWNISCSGFM